MRYGMVIDLKRCVGCYSCHIACKAENATPPGVFWARVLEKEQGEYPTATRIFLPVLCNHCKEPPCRDICPTGATTKRQDGIVYIDYDVCIGCRACMMACPYGIPRYEWEALVPRIRKCTMCHERVAEGIQPARLVDEINAVIQEEA